MKRYKKTAVSQYLVVAMILAAVIGLGLLGAYVMTRVAFMDHFAIPWAAGRSWLLEGISPYDPSVVDFAAAAIEETSYLGILPETKIFTLPLLSLLFYLPFSLIPYTISRVLWVTVLGICTGLIGLISIRLSAWKISPLKIFAAILMVILSVVSVNILLTGHLSPIIVLLMLVGLLLVINGQDTTAGLILALTASFFPSSGLFLVLLLIWSISRKRWSIISGFISGFIFLVVLSWLISPSWFLDWITVLLRVYEGWGWINTPLINLASFLPGLAPSLSIFLHAFFFIYVITLIVTVIGGDDRAFTYAMLAILVVTYFLHIQSSTDYLPLVFPAMFLLFHYWSERWSLLGKVLSWSLLIIFSLGPWLSDYGDFDFTTSPVVPLLSIGYPLILFFGLMGIRWWALRIPKLPYEVQ